MHVPEAHAGEIKIQDWFDTLVKAAKAKVIQPPTNGFAKAETIRADEVFPLKLRDEAIGMGFQFLRKAGVVPEVESSEEEAGSYEANYEVSVGVFWEIGRALTAFRPVVIPLLLNESHLFRLLTLPLCEEAHLQCRYALAVAVGLALV